MTSAYAELEARFKRRSLVEGATALLQWDLETLMPSGGAAERTEQLAALHVIGHEMMIDPALGDLFARAGEEKNLSPWQAANLREMRRDWHHATCLPADLVEARSKAISECELRWRKARPENDFKGLVPLLQRVLDFARETARIKGQAFGLAPYDALLDEYEPDMRAADITKLFDRLASFLPGFIDAAIERQARGKAPLRLQGPFPVASQEKLAKRLMTAIGFDFNHGRLDTSAHPFSGGVSDDVRLTTRWDENDFTRGLMGVLHETGHAMYARGLPADWRHQPVGDALGMAMHEGQSLLVEMQACRSREFISFLSPLAAEAFGGSGPAWSANNLYRLYTTVRRSPIRVDADEVTYPAHVILRYRLERAMISGDLSLADLPGAWAEGMKKLVGIVPPDDRDGCLQDIHWPGGAWGYFPTYTLGAMTAAQLFDAARRAVPEVPAALARGDFTPLMTWMRDRIHAQGSLVSTQELMIAATGKALDPDVYIAHLKHRYLDG
jgi:carboxypeptidase Taq